MLASDTRALESFHKKCQRQIQVKWHQFIQVMSDDIISMTALLTISRIISHCRNAVFSRLPGSKETQPTRHSEATSTWCLGDYRAVSESDLLAEPAAGGSIRSVRTMTTLHLQISSGVQPDMTIVEWHYGPRRLHAGILTMMTTRKNTSQKITSASYVMQTTQSYFSVATTSWFQLWNNDANNVRINCSCQWVEPRTRCNIIIPTFWVPDTTNHNA